MNPTDIGTDLLKEANDYVHTPASYTALEPHRASILTLRAKYASYEIIVEMLNKHDIKVSESTLRRFCRRYNKEMRSIRQELQAQKREGKEGAQSSLALAPSEKPLTPSDSSESISDMRGKP